MRPLPGVNQPLPTPLSISTRRPPHRAKDVILGLWDGHDAGAALVRRGRLVAAVSEERHTRLKRQGGFPHHALREVLELGGVSPGEVELVAVAGRQGRGPARLFDARYAATDPNTVDPGSPTSTLFAAYQNGAAAWPLVSALDRRATRWALSRRLREHGLHRAALRLVDHHRAHARSAAAALSPSPEPALVLTADGYGDGRALVLWRLEDGELTELTAQGPADSPALLYGALTRALGFREGEEGKLTGLAALGAPLGLGLGLRGHADGFTLDRRAALSALRRARLRGASPAALAATLQGALEEAALELVRAALARSGLRRLAVAGGLFANVALNGRLATLALSELAVAPAMTDQGLCAGAALELAPRIADPVPTLLLGTPAGTAGPDPAHIAAILARGEPVAVVRGRMEFGPRALGARSILLHAGCPEAARRLGASLGRAPFMPFGPVLLAERAAEAFACDLAPVAGACRAMTVALPARGAFIEAAGAAVHRDGTARPQLVDPAEDPWLAALLRAFTAETGCPALVNTSFNRHREPIVRTAAEGRAAAAALGVHAVVGGELLSPGAGGPRRAWRAGS